MARSAFFTRIKTDVVAIVAAIPRGKLTTYREIGQWLDVPPRHVAYILAQLTGEEQAVIPWFRVVAEGGKVGDGRANPFKIGQRALIAEEGHQFGPDGIVIAFETAFQPVGSLDHGIARQLRPADAPVARSKPSRARQR